MAEIGRINKGAHSSPRQKKVKRWYISPMAKALLEATYFETATVQRTTRTLITLAQMTPCRAT